MSSQWADEQPKDGDIVLHCEHVGRAETFHWWKVPEGTYSISTATGDNVLASWLTACDFCFNSSKGNPLDIQFVGHRMYHGSKPIIPKAN